MRILSVLGFSFLFAYLMAFLFEGQELYVSFDYTIGAIAAHFAGLISCGFFVKSAFAAKRAVIIGMAVCLPATLPIFFPPSALWLPSLILGGYASGCAVAAWGHFLKSFAAKNERIKSCADALIFSNILMIIINIVAVRVSLIAGLVCVMASMGVGMMFISVLPAHEHYFTGNKMDGEIKKPLAVLLAFITLVSVNSGLMYQVINPAFAHLSELASWYWAIPYIAAIAVLRCLPLRAHRAAFLYAGMAMMVGAFVSFMLLGRNALHYIIIDTLLLGACGIFDLFWWSVLGEMLDYTDNPVKVFGIGLSANVFGILCGGIIGIEAMSSRFSGAELAVIALVVVCITLSLLPPLNKHLAALLTERNAVSQAETTEPLTERERDVLQLILSGKSNSVIAENLSIKESTVKTHAGNIYAKYNVASRAELISSLLKN